VNYDQSFTLNVNIKDTSFLCSDLLSKRRFVSLSYIFVCVMAYQNVCLLVHCLIFLFVPVCIFVLKSIVFDLRLLFLSAKNRIRGDRLVHRP